MKKGIVVLAASYPSRIFKKRATPKSPDILALCSGGYIMIAAESKKKRLPLLYFFSTDNRSEVMFSLHENPRFGLSPKGKTAPDGRSFRENNECKSIQS